MAQEQVAPSEVSARHKDETGNHEGGARRPISSLDSLSMKEGNESGGHASDHEGEGNKIRHTDFSSLKVPFPWRLWQLLEDSEKNGNQSIVSWLPDGDGFVISKPRTFTNTIMKAYFALTTYDSFSQELLRYGFSRSTKDEDKLTRVDVFRNPRYNRKEKLRSLAIRRRSVTRSFSDRLTAAKLNQKQHENDGGSSFCAPMSTAHDPLNNPVLMSLSTSPPQTQVSTGSFCNQHDVQANTHDARHHVGLVAARIPGLHSDPAPSSPSLFFPNNSETYHGRGIYSDFSFIMDNYKIYQHPQPTSDSFQNTTSIPTQFQQAAPVPEIDIVSSFSSPNPMNMPMINVYHQPQEQPVYKNEEPRSTGSLQSTYNKDWIAPTRDNDQHSDLLRRAWQFLESGSGSDAVFPPQTLRSTTPLTGILPAPASYFSNKNSGPSQISNHAETQQELEKTLDEDIMESIFD